MSTHKWVENNTFYSSSSPSIEIHINQRLQAGSEDSKIIMSETSTGAVSLFIHTDNYVFWDEDGKQQLSIQISNLNNTRYYMENFNFSSNPAFLKVAEERIAEWSFDTGTYVNTMPQQSFLVKIYGKNFGQQTRLLLHYLEGVDNSWNTPDLVLNSKQKTFLEGFEKRAEESFTIRPYSGVKPPERKADNPVFKK